MIGRVVANKMPKTVTVLVERQKKHPLYRKSFIRSKKYLVDDSVGVKLGDLVEIEKCRPISKMKHFKIVKVVGKDLVDIAEAKLKKHAKEVIAEVLPAHSSLSLGAHPSESKTGRQVMPVAKNVAPEEKSEEGVVDSNKPEEKIKKPTKRVKKGDKE